MGMKRYARIEIGSILILLVEQMGLIGGERHSSSLSLGYDGMPLSSIWATGSPCIFSIAICGNHHSRLCLHPCSG